MTPRVRPLTLALVLVALVTRAPLATSASGSKVASCPPGIAKKLASEAVVSAVPVRRRPRWILPRGLFRPSDYLAPALLVTVAVLAVAVYLLLGSPAPWW